MEVKLVVLTGKKAGQEVPLTGPKFFIGRAEDCHLRPHSELVSRHHCVIICEEGYLAVRDFGSKNGTMVNGQMVRGEQELKSGDQLKVGDLDFEVRVDVSVGGKKKPKVESVQEAAARTVQSAAADEMDLDNWLSETDTQVLDPTLVDASQTGRAGSGADEEQEPSDDKQKRSWKKRQGGIVGVWGKGRWKATAANPTEAAAETLKNFFRRHGEVPRDDRKETGG